MATVFLKLCNQGVILYIDVCILINYVHCSCSCCLWTVDLCLVPFKMFCFYMTDLWFIKHPLSEALQSPSSAVIRQWLVPVTYCADCYVLCRLLRTVQTVPSFSSIVMCGSLLPAVTSTSTWGRVGGGSRRWGDEAVTSYPALSQHHPITMGAGCGRMRSRVWRQQEFHQLICLH